jgi:hypothetical protein
MILFLSAIVPILVPVNLYLYALVLLVVAFIQALAVQAVVNFSFVPTAFYFMAILHFQTVWI